MRTDLISRRSLALVLALAAIGAAPGMQADEGVEGAVPGDELVLPDGGAVDDGTMATTDVVILDEVVVDEPGDVADATDEVTVTDDMIDEVVDEPLENVIDDGVVYLDGGAVQRGDEDGGPVDPGILYYSTGNVEDHVSGPAMYNLGGDAAVANVTEHVDSAIDAVVDFDDDRAIDAGIGVQGDTAAAPARVLADSGSAGAGKARIRAGHLVVDDTVR
ncbi:MAG: hypothetical protein IT495_18270 [Gammaproteobacteria bacterium]|nr:hypothetical protein [Gammaproteobacteria bacterium]